MSAWISPSLLIIMSPLGENRVGTVGEEGHKVENINA